MEPATVLAKIIVIGTDGSLPIYCNQRANIAT